MELWLIIGVLCLILEFTSIPNIGFLFLGLGALSNCLLISRYSFSLNYQFILFGVTSLSWFTLLWLPLKRYIYKTNVYSGYSDMVGKEVQVYSDSLAPNLTGQVKWSGVIMNAKLDSAEKGVFKARDNLVITRVQGNVLICAKAKEKR